MLECLLFDLDGLLVDSEPLQYRAYRKAFKHYGIDLSMDDWIRWHSAEASTPRWIESQGLDLDVAQLRALKKTCYDHMIATELTLKPGVDELLQDCAGQFRMAVVSASRRESIEACLDKFDLGRHFSTLISGNEMARSKPFPDPYNTALDALQANPANAMALEDSLTGYRSARAAGLACVVCPDHFIPKPANAFADAAGLTESLQQISVSALHAIHAAHRQSAGRPQTTGDNHAR